MNGLHVTAGTDWISPTVFRLAQSMRAILPDAITVLASGGLTAATSYMHAQSSADDDGILISHAQLKEREREDIDWRKNSWLAIHHTRHKSIKLQQKIWNKTSYIWVFRWS